MPMAIRIHEHGGPEKMVWEEVAIGNPGPGEALIRHNAIGLNYIDVYMRTGLYPMSLPAILGMEGSGLVLEVGEGVKDIKNGDRVAYAAQPAGAYAQKRLIPADRLVKLPDDITDQAAAAMMLQGLTAQYLLCRTCAVQPGDTILIHAAAGGVGLIVCQWAKHIGARVIGTVGSDEKAEIARHHGCDYPIVYTQENFTDRVREITDGAGVRVVYDSIGKDTFAGSLDCLRPMGLMVTFGNASGPIPPMELALLGKKGSLFLTRPSMFNYTARRDDLIAMADDLFDVVRHGHVKIEINQTYPLKEVAQAHRDLESRKTTGSTIFLP